MDVQVDRLGKIQTEDTHDGLCINYVSAGYKIEIIIELSNIVYERFYLINRISRNLNCLHVDYLLNVCHTF